MAEAPAPADPAPVPPVVAEPLPSAAATPPPSAAPVAGSPKPVLLGEAPRGIEDSAPSEGEKKPRMFGAMFDLGVPDGTMLSFVYRPLRVARFHAGLGYNGVSPGVRLGGVLLPFGWGPSLSLDYGHYFEGDANGLAGMFAGPTDEGSALLENIGYDFVNLRLGMEVGGDRFTFFGRGGVSWVSSTIHEFNTLLASDDPDNSRTSITVNKDPVLNAFGPSLQLGLIVQL